MHPETPDGGWRLHARQHLSSAEAISLVEQLERTQNEDLLLVLEQEQANELQRNAALVQVVDPSERQQLELAVADERARATNRIMSITTEHKAVLLRHISALGLMDSSET